MSIKELKLKTLLSQLSSTDIANLSDDATLEDIKKIIEAKTPIYLMDRNALLLKFIDSKKLELAKEFSRRNLYLIVDKTKKISLEQTSEFWISESRLVPGDFYGKYFVANALDLCKKTKVEKYQVDPVHKQKLIDGVDPQFGIPWGEMDISLQEIIIWTLSERPKLLLGLDSWGIYDLFNADSPRLKVIMNTFNSVGPDREELNSELFLDNENLCTSKEVTKPKNNRRPPAGYDPKYLNDTAISLNYLYKNDPKIFLEKLEEAFTSEELNIILGLYFSKVKDNICSPSMPKSQYMFEAMRAINSRGELWDFIKIIVKERPLINS